MAGQAVQRQATHYRHHRRVAGEGRRVVSPPCPRSTAARLQRSPVGRLQSFRSWSSHLFRGRPGGRRHMRSGGRLSDMLMWTDVGGGRGEDKCPVADGARVDDRLR